MPGRVLATLCLLTATVAALGLPLPAHAGPQDNQCWRFRDDERAMAEKINKVRTRGRWSFLHLDPELSKVARAHTREMVLANRLYHQSAEVLDERVTNWNLIGENVGVGGDIERLHQAFMDSEVHRDNILFERFRHVGVGTFRWEDRLWVTVLFATKGNPGTTMNMPDCAQA